MSSTTSSSSLLLGVLVKCAKIQSSDNESCAYVVLKIDNVKSTTSVVKGTQPSWEQEFYFDVPDRSVGLQVELWERGQFWDKRLGLCHLRFDRSDEQREDNHSIFNPDGTGAAYERWITLDAELISNRQRQVTRTCQPTGHSICLRTYVEFPSDLTEEESKELTEKLEILHEILDKEGRQLQDVTFDELNSLSNMHSDQAYPLHYQHLTHRSHSHFSDDSDYTSDVSYPLNSQANVNYPVGSMSPANVSNENASSSLTKKPLAFVQPVIRDSSRRTNHEQIEKFYSSTTTPAAEEPLSYVSQPRKMTTQPHPTGEGEEYSNHHYSLSSEKPNSSSNHDQPPPANLFLSASKVKWIDAVRTVKQLNQVSSTKDSNLSRGRIQSTPTPMTRP